MKDPKSIRKKLQLNQTEFWRRVHVTQSAGSRYETSDRAIPAPVRALLTIAYGNDAERQAELKRMGV